MLSKESSAVRRVKVARSQLLQNRPAGVGAFFGVLAMRLELVEDKSIKRPMVTDGRVLKFDPKRIDAMNPQHLLSLVAQAVTRCASAHHVRRGSRKDVQLYDAAGQYVVNPQLVEAGFSLPDDALIDPRFENMSIERVYSMLEMERPPSGGGQGKQQGKGQKGQQQGKSQKGQGDPNDDSGWGAGVEPPKKDKEEGDGEGEGEDDGDLSREELENERLEWEIAATQAAAVAEKQHGNLPAFAQRFIKELHRPKVNPWHVLREFVQEQMQASHVWTPPNRRFISSGWYFPSLKSDDALGEIVVVVDTSGSIGERELNEFASHIKAIHEDFQPRRTVIIYADAAINHVDEFNREDTVAIKPHGGGGTDFRPAFRYVEKNHLEPACFLYLTDLCGPAPEKPPEYPVLWCCNYPNQKAPWGSLVDISNCFV